MMVGKLPRTVLGVCVLVALRVHLAWPLLAGERVVEEAGKRPPVRLEAIDRSGLPNFHRVTDDLYRGAQPTSAGFRELKKLGIRTVVNLRWTHSSRFACTDVGLDYEHIGIKSFHGHVGHVISLLEILADTRRTPVFVYCMNGADRTGFLCAAYRVVVCGWSRGQALREMMDTRFGQEVSFRNLPTRIRNMDVEAVRKAVGLPSAAAGQGGVPQELAHLRVFREGYPRACFFRAAEGMASDPRVTYERWEKTFSRLMGIEGKCLDEEVPGRSRRNIDFFTRFKKAHPDQLVLLHYNGNARDPRYQTAGRYFAGHWLYHNGARVLSDVPAEDGETDIRVGKPQLFGVGVGRYRTSNEDIGLCLLGPDGKPDWHQSEQVQLVSVDVAKRTIRVRRGCYGTKPRAFGAGKAYAAAHAHEGPWGRRSNLMWFYNYSTRCPRDANGRTCADVHAAEIAAHFAPGAQLAAFDGLEFDVLSHTRRAGGGRGLDCDADGQIDNGVFDGVNTYGVGVVEFCRKLREKFGDGKLILADGHGIASQRAFHLLNGIESEGWPTLSDWEVKDWSGGLNRHFFWAANGRPPVFNYVNHKFVTRGDTPGTTRRPDVPWNIHRLVFAAAVFTDSAICYSYAPPKQKDELLGTWDELRMGTANRVGWLGKPLGPAIRLAERQPDVLGGRGSPVTRDLLARFSGEGVRFALEKGGLKVSAAAQGRGELRFRLRGVPCDGPDLTVLWTARGEPMRGYPREIARLVWVGIPAPDGHLTRAEPPRTGMCLRGGEEAPIDPATGAVVRWRPRVMLGDEARACLFVHPPWKKAVGYTFWERQVRVPKAGRLDFHTGMGHESPERSDGVTFSVLVAQVSDGKVGPYQRIFEHVQKAWKWTHHTLPLAKWGGKAVRLKFISDCGPADNATTDHGHWGDVWVLGPQGLDGVTRAARHMTWASETSFTSGITFTEVKPKQVDLEFVVEGEEPVWISRITAHAHPDAMCREFERGVVLANPSPRPYAIDLATLFPGRRFRRIQGSSRQDPVTNNGQPVGGTLTLGPKDAVFLVRAAP